MDSSVIQKLNPIKYYFVGTFLNGSFDAFDLYVMFKKLGIG